MGQREVLTVHAFFRPVMLILVTKNDAKHVSDLSRRLDACHI